MKKLYFIYAIIPENLYNSKIKYLISNIHDFRWKHGKMYGLYAWTTSKKIVKEFFEVRDKNIYTLVKNDIYEKEEIQKVRDLYTDLELKLRRYYFTEKQEESESILIPTTKNEFIQSTEYFEENLYEFGPNIEESVHYNIFKDKIIEALDIIGYVKNYDIRYGSDSDRDVLFHNMGFGYTKLGNIDKTRYNNQMNILLYLFGYFFFGNNNELKDVIE